MMLLVNAEMVELEIRPTHRLLLDADTDALRGLVSGDDPLWQAIPVAPADLGRTLDERRNDDEPAFGLVLPDDDGFLLLGDPAGLGDRLRRESMSRAVQALDLAALPVDVLDDRLGISRDGVARRRRLVYRR